MNQTDNNLLAACPICGAASPYEYSGRDLMFELHARYDYYVCPVCDCVFQSPTPDMETIASFYPETYMVFDQETRTRKISKLQLALLQRTCGYDHLRSSLPYRLLAAFMAEYRRPTTPAWGGADAGCGLWQRTFPDDDENAGLGCAGR